MDVLNLRPLKGGGEKVWNVPAEFFLFGGLSKQGLTDRSPAEFKKEALGILRARLVFSDNPTIFLLLASGDSVVLVLVNFGVIADLLFCEISVI